MKYESMTVAQQVDTLRAMVEKSVGHSVQVHLDAESQAHREAFHRSRNTVVHTEGFDSQGRPVQAPVQRFDAQGRPLAVTEQRYDSQGRPIPNPTRLYLGGTTMNKPLRSEQERKAAADSLRKKQQALQQRQSKNPRNTKNPAA